MSKCDTIVPLIYAMKKRKDAVHIAAETIKKLYEPPPIPELVQQVSKGCSMLTPARLWHSVQYFYGAIVMHSP